MKSGIPWSVKGIDPDLREVAKTAARRSGMTLGAWLGSAINEQADGVIESKDLRPLPHAYSGNAAAQHHPSMDRAASTLEDIAGQLSRLAARETEGAYRAPKIDEQYNYGKILSRIESNEKQTVEAFSAVNERLSTISRQITRVQTPQVAKPEDSINGQSLDKVVRHIVENLEATDRRNRESIKALQDRFNEISSRVTSAPSEQMLRQAPAFSQLESRLTELARRVEQPLAPAPLNEQLRLEIAQLTNRIDSIRDTSETLAHKAQTQAVQSAQVELRAIEARIIGLLNEAKQSIAGNQVGPAELQRFRQEFERLHDRIDETYNSSASGQDLSALRQMVEQLSTRVAQSSDTQPFAEMDRKILEISQKLERAEANTRGLPQVSELEQRFAELDQRLSQSVSAPTAQDGSQIAAKLADVDDRLAKAESQFGHLETIERAVSMLYDAMEKNRDETQAMLQASQASALPSLAAAPEITALEQGLQAVRNASAQSDQRNQETLEAVHETLEQIVGKLAELETAAIGQRVSQAATAPRTGSPAAQTLNMVMEAQVAPHVAQRAAVAPEQAEAKKSERLFVPDAGEDFMQPSFGGESNPFSPNQTDASPAHGSNGIGDLVAAARRLHHQAGNASASTVNASTLNDVVPDKSGRAKKTKGFSLPFTNKDKSVDSELHPKAANNNSSSRTRLVMLGFLVLAVASFAVSNKIGRSFSTSNTAAPVTIEKTVQPATPIDKGTKSSPVPVPTITGEQQSEIEDLSDTADSIKTASLPSAKQIPEALSKQVDDGSLTKTVDATVGPFKLRQAAEKGDAEAQFIVATHYLEGDTVAVDYAKAAAWYGKAASSGLAPAQYRLATLYERGKGVEKDLSVALSWYERAGELGNVKAMHNAAVIAAGSEMGEPDYERAKKWFSLAASHGLKDSEFNLAVLIERGLGVKQDQTEALFWYMAAAAQGDADAKARVDVLSKSLSPTVVSSVKTKLKNWTPEKAPDAANVVAIDDAQWNPSEKAASLSPAQSTDSDIVTAKNLLQKMGYRIGEISDEMDARTTNAVKLFQIKQGLKVTGEVTPELLEKLQSKVG